MEERRVEVNRREESGGGRQARHAKDSDMKRWNEWRDNMSTRCVCSKPTSGLREQKDKSILKPPLGLRIGLYLARIITQYCGYLIKLVEIVF